MATEPDKIDSGVLGTILAVLTFGVLGTALAVTALVRTENDELAAERSQANDTVAALRGSQEADLNLPAAYIDKDAGKVRVPIDRAMQVVVRDLRRNPQSATWPASKTAQANGDKPEAGTEDGTAKKPGGKDEKETDDAAVKPPPAPKAPAAPRAPRAPKPPPAPGVPAPKPAPVAPKPPPVAPKPPAPPPVAPPAP
jgi:hypothetical protein